MIPVVGDGRWIWTQPPSDGVGYLEPRTFDLDVGIELEASGSAVDIISTTTVPIEYPEQKIESVELETSGCQARLRQLAPGAGQLVLVADAIEAGQTIKAVAHYRLKLFKQYFGYKARPVSREAGSAGGVAPRLSARQPGHSDAASKRSATWRLS